MCRFLSTVIIFFTVCLLPATGSLAASGDPVAPHHRIKLKVFNRVDATSTHITGKADRAVLEAFKKKYPYIDITTFNGLDIDGASLMAVAGGTSPDVIYLNMKGSESYIRQGIVQPLDDLMAEVPSGDINDRYIPGVRRVAYRRGPDGRKHWYAVPYGNLVTVLFYHKALFREAGLHPDKPPRDWGELLQYARRITDPDKGVYGMGFSTGKAVSYVWYTFLASAGGEMMVEDSSGDWKLKYNSDVAVRAARFFTRMIQEPFVKNGKTVKTCVYSDTDIIDKFSQGKVGMHLGYLDDKMIAAINPFTVGIAPWPGDGLGHRGSELNATMMGLYAGVKDPEIKDAAFKFMWFWDGPEARAIRTRIFVENGYGGFVNPQYLRRYGYTEYLKYVPKGWEETLNQAMKNGHPEPYGKNCEAIYSMVDRPIQQMLAEGVGHMSKKKANLRIRQLLDKSVVETDAMLLGTIPPDVQRTRRTVALIVSLVIVIAFSLVFSYLMKIFTPPDSGGTKAWDFRKYWLAYLLLVPAVSTIFIWHYIPLLRGAAIAFYDYRIMGGSTLVWLDNFADVLFDPFFWKTMLNTLYYAALWLGLGFFAPVILALFLSEVPRLKVFYRVLFYLPAVISGIVVMFMWKSFYDPSAAGLLNKVVSIFGIESQAWLQNPHLAMLCIIIPLVWAGMGPGCLIYLAALKSVPEELYEAADLDGAGTMRKVRHITLPMIKPLIIINLMGAFIGAFNSADFVLVMTGGGPNYATHVVGLEVFYNAFCYLKFGRAAAIGWLMSLVLLGFTAYQMKRLSNMTFKAGGAS
ncbi:MAG: extracellular solute-binding protein [bacterium]|nr:extracellular solute-binding protein [bacterium]